MFGCSPQRPVKGVAYSGRRRFSKGNVESFVPWSIEISVKANHALTIIVKVDVIFCYDVCCQVFICKKRQIFTLGWVCSQRAHSDVSGFCHSLVNRI